MTGIILAGGENKRMGADKAFLELAGRPVIEHILRVLSGLFRGIIIVTNTPDRYKGYDAKVVRDALDRRGPLTGIYSGMLASGDEYNFVVACDMPFLNRRLVSYMSGLAEGHDAVVPRIAGLLEPLHAVYRKSLLPAIESRLHGDRRQITGIFRESLVRYVSEEEIRRIDPKMRSFVNLNTPEEYKEALCSDLACRN